MSVIYEPEYRVFIDCLRELRLNSKMSQQELATILGCSQSYISKYEQCQKRIDVIETRKICLCLGISLSEFVSQFEDKLSLGGL